LSRNLKKGEKNNKTRGEKKRFFNLRPVDTTEAKRKIDEKIEEGTDPPKESIEWRDCKNSIEDYKERNEEDKRYILFEIMEERTDSRNNQDK